MATHNLGRVAYADKGAYNSSTTYINKDVVQYNNGSYVLQADTATGIVPTNTSYWTPMQNPTALNQATASANTAAQSANTAANSAVKAAETANTVMNNTASPIRKSATGKYIELGNAADKPLRGLKLYGRTEQIKTTGKNLLPINSVNTSQNHAGFVELTYLTVGTYTLSADITKYANDTATHTRLGCKVEYTDGTTENFSCPIDELNAERDGIARKKQATFHIRSDKTFKAIYIWLLDYSDVSGGRNAKAEHAQLERGSVATSYEPYTGGAPSPSPNYPQPLVSPGDSGSIGVRAMGKNLLPEFVSGYWDVATGAAVDDTGQWVRSPHLIPCNPGNTYTLNKSDGTAPTFSGYIVLFDSDKKGTRYFNTPTTFTIAENERYIGIYMSYTTYAENKPLQLALSPFSSSFEPYKDGGSLTASTPNGLPGIKVPYGGNYTDANGQQWICDEKDYERGVYMQRIARYYLDGSVPPGMHDQNGYMRFAWEGTGFDYIPLDYLRPDMQMCNRFVPSLAPLQGNDVNGTIATYWPGGIYLRYDGATSVEEMVAYLAENPIEYMYVMATPIETPIPADELASYRAMSTFDPYTVVYNDANAEMIADYIGETEKFVHEVIDDRAAPPIVPTATGEVVTISDSAHRPLAGLKLYGTTTQATTTGKNLLPNTVSTTVNNGITFTSNTDGTIAANGTSMVDYDAYCIVGTATLVVGEKYLLTGCPSGGGFGIGLDGTGIYDWGDGIEFTAETANYTAVLIVSKNKTISNIVFKPMIRLASVTDATYEPYTGGIPSPNPNYPQELANVGAGGSIKAYSRGKNLLNIAAIVPSSAVYNGITITSLGGGFTVTGTATSNAAFKWLLDKPIPAGTYWLHARNIGFNSSTTLYFEKPGTVDVGHTELSSDYRKQKIAFDGDLVYLKLYIPSGQTVDMRLYPMLTVEDTDTWELYKDGGSLTASTPGGLAGLPFDGCAPDLIDFGAGLMVQNVQRIVLDGDEDIKYDQDAFNVANAMDSGGRAYMHGLCNAYPVATNYNQFISGDYAVCNWSNNALRIRHGGNTDVASFKAWLAANPVTLYFPLPTPRYTTVSDDEMAEYRAMKTLKPHTVVYNDAGAVMHVDYIADTKNYIDQKLAAIAATLIAQ